jgi:hypothetical protein
MPGEADDDSFPGPTMPRAMEMRESRDGSEWGEMEIRAAERVLGWERACGRRSSCHAGKTGAHRLGDDSAENSLARLAEINGAKKTKGKT